MIQINIPFYCPQQPAREVFGTLLANTTRHRQRSGKADPPGHTVTAGRFQHQPAHQVQNTASAGFQPDTNAENPISVSARSFIRRFS